MSSSPCLSERVLSNEMTAILAECLGADPGPVSVHLALRMHDDGVDFMVRWREVQYLGQASGADLRASLDDFSTRFLLPAAMELCGRPLLDAGRIVVNAVHDERETA